MCVFRYKDDEKSPRRPKSSWSTGGRHMDNVQPIGRQEIVTPPETNASLNAPSTSSPAAHEQNIETEEVNKQNLRKAKRFHLVLSRRSKILF